MPNIQLIQPAPEQLYQLNRFYRRNGHKGKAKPSDTAFWLEQQGEIIAGVRFSAAENGVLLRGLWVATEKRRQGLGSQLLRDTRTFWQHSTCYCFPYNHLEAFYTHHGFKRLDESTTPAPLDQQLERYLRRGEKVILMAYQPPCD